MARAHVIASEYPETIESDPLYSPINVNIITGIISPSSLQEKVLNPDERVSGFALCEDISSNTATIEDIAVAVVEEIADGVFLLGTIALMATAQQIAADVAVIEGVAAVAAGEILTQATSIDAAIAATAVELGTADIETQEDIVETVGDTLPQPIPDKVADAKR